MDGDLKDLLQRKADEVRTDAKMPAPVLRRARRRRIGNALVAGLTAAAVVAGAFVGVRVALQGNPTHKRGGFVANPTAHQLWLTMNHQLFMTTRETQGTPEATMQALLAGPTADESGATVSSSIPTGTELQGLSIDNGLARVQLSSSVQSDPLSDAQVVYTLTQFPDVQRVLINDQEGGPLTRNDLAGQLPPILLQHPAIGDTVTSPITISGTANVFEGTVSIRVIAGEGTTLADTFTTATCGTGCRGAYSKQVSYTLDQRQTGTIEVFEASAKDGSPINVVRIPVTLEPSTAGPPTSWDGVWRPDFTNATIRAGANQVTAALAFAKDILGWDASQVHLESVGGPYAQVVDLWNTDMTTTFSRDLATQLAMKQVGTEWTVWHVESGLFAVTCPSPRQDGLITESGSGRMLPQEICGSINQPPAGWTVQATLEYSDSSLQPSEAQSTIDVPVNGSAFHGLIPLTATYANADVTVMIRVYSGSGAILGVWARRFVTAQMSPSPSPSP